jgi:hypothetical protein
MNSVRCPAAIAVALAASLGLAGCASMVSVENVPTTPTPTAPAIIETRTVAPTASREPPAEPAPVPATFITKYEFLGEGTANIVYARAGSQIIQETVTLPHEIVLNSGSSPTPNDIYLSAGAAYTRDGDVVGCRIARNNVIIDEVIPVAGSISALCDSN